MTDADYKQYTENARRGIKGEAFFESLVVEHAIPHRIARQNDLGIDFLCEWIYRDRPSGSLFLAQVKTTTSSHVSPEFVCKSTLNGLDKYMLTGAGKVDDRTINYWKGLGLPAFLFYVIEGGSGRDCYHKRYTPLRDGKPGSDDPIGSKSFHRVNPGPRFLAFADPEKEIGGFARDLIIDYARLSYSKGQIVPLTPSQLGFWPFENKTNPDVVRYFGELVGWHQDKIRETCEWTMALLRRLRPEDQEDQADFQDKRRS
jgi:Domain of unknown function (DUF4365)